MRTPVARSEAAAAIALCWAVSAVGYAVFAALDQPTLHMTPLILMGLARWFFVHHRYWRAATAAALTGSAVFALLLDPFRAAANPYVANALVTALATTAAVAVFTAVTRARPRAGRVSAP
ncbi:hypothetical protein [Streptomyces sp. NPDC001478]